LGEAVLVYEEFNLRGIAGKVLIVVPSGLGLQWHEELECKFNEHFVIYSKEYIRSLVQNFGEGTNVWKQHDKIIAPIDSIKPLKVDDSLNPREKARREWHNNHVFNDLAEAGFDIVIIDEAHKLSKYGDGSETARFKLGQLLSRAAPVLLLLTATPHQGDENLFLNLLRLIDPALFTSPKSITPELVQEVTVRNKKRAVVDFDGNRIFKNRITSLLEIHRTRQDNPEELDLYDYVTEYTGKYYNLAKRGNNQLLMLLVMLYQRIVSSSSFALLEAMQRRQAFLAGQAQKMELLLAEDRDEEDIDFDELLRQAIFTQKEDYEAEKVFVENCIHLAEKCTAGYRDSKFRKLVEFIDEIIKRENKQEL